MKKDINPVPLTTAIIAGLFLYAVSAFANHSANWTSPIQAPPGGNAVEPLNVGPGGQTKHGGLTLAIDPTVRAGLIVLNGNVGIGLDPLAENVNSKLSVRGNVTLKRPTTNALIPGHELALESASAVNISTERDAWVDATTESDTCNGDREAVYACSGPSDVGRQCRDVANGIFRKKSNLTCVANTEQFSLRANRGNLEFLNNRGIPVASSTQAGDFKTAGVITSLSDVCVDPVGGGGKCLSAVTSGTNYWAPAPSEAISIHNTNPGGVWMTGLAFADTSGTLYRDNWIGMLSSADIEGGKKILHIGGITDTDNVRRVGIWANKIFLQGAVGINTLTPQRLLDVEGTEIHSGGGAGGFSFENRSTGSIVGGTTGDRWVWYSDGPPGGRGVARLWTETFGDQLTVTPVANPDGSQTPFGKISVVRAGDFCTISGKCLSSAGGGGGVVAPPSVTSQESIRLVRGSVDKNGNAIPGANAGFISSWTGNPGLYTILLNSPYPAGSYPSVVASAGSNSAPCYGMIARAVNITNASFQISVNTPGSPAPGCNESFSFIVAGPQF